MSPIYLHLIVKASFPSTFPAHSTLIFLVETEINTESSAVISLSSLVLGVSNKSPVFSLELFNQIYYKKKLISVTFFRYNLYLKCLAPCNISSSCMLSNCFLFNAIQFCRIG